MKIQAQTKKLNLQLRVLLNEVIDYNWGSYFGVQAMDPNVLRLWTEYNEIRNKLVSTKEFSSDEFPELSYPQPNVASDDSFFKEGTMIYQTEHFSALRQSIEKVLEALRLSILKESA